MPFDYVMGVGRMPKITEDIKLSPYALSNQDFATTANIYLNYASGTEEGDLRNINNVYFDFSTGAAYAVTQNTANSSFFIQFDKLLYLQKFILQGKAIAITTTGNLSIVLNFYDDYNQLLRTKTEVLSITTTTKDFVVEVNYLSRVRRVEIFFGTTSNIKTSFYKIYAFADNIQYST